LRFINNISYGSSIGGVGGFGGGIVYPVQRTTPGAGVDNGGYKDTVVAIPLTVVRWIVAYLINSSIINAVLLVGGIAAIMRNII
jgi:hypothetical protein